MSTARTAVSAKLPAVPHNGVHRHNGLPASLVGGEDFAAVKCHADYQAAIAGDGDSRGCGSSDVARSVEGFNTTGSR